jgi:hypothetical protein
MTPTRLVALASIAALAGCGAPGKPANMAAEATAPPPSPGGYDHGGAAPAAEAPPAYHHDGAYGGGSHAELPAPDVAIPAPDDRPGLGTTWGEHVYSPVTHRPFERATSAPWAVAALHYNDEDGVRAHATYVGGTIAPLEAMVGDGSIGVSLVDDGGDLLPGVRASGRNLVVGEDGERYRIVIRNATSARFEVVTSVDGLDVIDGKPASFARRGYLVDPGGSLVIDGFRQTESEVAAFRFGRVSSSYAAKTSGDANVGVIGFAIFAAKGATWTRAELGRRDAADPFPNRYATPPN